jgi:hypothetical protein
LDRDALRNGLANLQVTFSAKSDQELATSAHFQSFAIHTAQLLVGISAEPAFARLRKHFENRNSAEVEAWFKDIHTTIERARVADSVIDKLKPFGKWLQDEFLASLRKKVCAGESISHEICEMEAGARQLNALQMLDESRALREGLEGELLSALEQNQATLPTNGDIGAAWWAATQLSAYLSWKDRCEHEAPILRKMDPTQYEQQQRRLAETSKEKRDLEAKFITEIWRARQAERSRAQFAGVLVTQGPKSKRLREVIELGERIGLFDFRPCWLTNPNTASQIFPLVENFFDLIVFDEASQCPIELLTCL